MTGTQTTPAGWYNDDQGIQRWWDGSQWTEHTQHSKTEAPAPKVKAETVWPEGTIWGGVGRPLTGIGGGRYRLTDTYLFFEKGTLSLKSQQIYVHEIHDVDAQQTMAQKARGLGTITLVAHRPTGPERVLLEDIPNFREGVAAISEAADASRLARQQRSQTQTVNYSGAPAMQAAAASGAPDLNVELAKLADFHRQGVLTDDEFSAAKKKLLGL
jgi:hypothetical protein